MKKMISILAVLAMGVSVMADVVITEASTAPGELVLDVAADPAIAGLALEVTVDSGTLSSVAMTGFNVYIDEAYSTPGFTSLDEIDNNPAADADAPGAITDLTGTFALCAGSLTADHAGVTAATITFTSDEGVVVTIAADETRGGAVAVDGTEVAVIGGTFGVITPTCPEDLNESGFVEAGDIGMILAKWGMSSEDCSGDLDYICIEDLNGSGFVEAGDIGMILDKWGMSAAECAAAQ